MDHSGSVSSRTRMKRYAHLLSAVSSSRGGGSSQGQRSGKKRGRGTRENGHDPDVVFLGEKVVPAVDCESTDSGAGAGAESEEPSSSRFKGTKRSSDGDLKNQRLGESTHEEELVERRTESFVVPPHKEVIDLVDNDCDDNDNGDAVKEGVKPSENHVGFEDAVHVETENDDEEHGLRAENPITIDSEGGYDSEESGGGYDETDSSDFYLSSSSSDTQDYGESSDEDFQVDDETVGSSSDDESSSYDEHDEKEKQRKKIPRRNEATSSPSMDQERKVETQSSAVCASVTSAERQSKGYCSAKLDKVKGKKVAKKSDAESVERTWESGGAENVEAFGDSHDHSGRSKPCEVEVEKDNEKQSGWRGHQGVSVHKEKRDSTSKIAKNVENVKRRGENKESWREREDNGKERGKYKDKGKEKEVEGENKGWVNTKNHERNEWFSSKTGYRIRYIQRNPPKPKKVHLIELLVECFASKSKRSTIRDGSSWVQEKEDGEEDGDVHQGDTHPPVQALDSDFPFWRKKDPPIEKTESEKEKDMLWKEMDMLLRVGEVSSQVGCANTNEAGQNRESAASLCRHNLTLDEEIGMYCKRCHFIETHIKDITPPFVEESNARSRRRQSFDGVDVSPFDEDQFKASDGGSKAACSHNEGTVWDLIPGVKQNLYTHQQEGFEFLWTNLAGTMDLGTLKSVDPTSAGGCIISHAPGTGKTKLTIMFLQTYLNVFPECHSVIIAPASLLLNWEDEFRKWDIGIPFHNLNNPELSGKEHLDAMKILVRSPNLNKNMDDIRMAKLYSWFKEKSILGISYHLYEIIVGKNFNFKKGTRKKKKNEEKEKRRESKTENTAREVMGKILREEADLLVLDEGHTPRNQRSQIWKVLSEVQTRKRIMLSGTPFQNNFLELYNTLCLVKPSFPDKLPHELKKFCQSRLMKEKKASEGVTWESGSSSKTTGTTADDKIRQLKLLMDPFVHVHKGSILQKNLPGLRDCLLTLMPDKLQKELLESIECSQNTLNFEHKLTLVSVHPSLFLQCSLTEKEESVIDKDHLKSLRLNPYVGVKTRFLLEFVRLCEAVNEKVLVFSQFIDPLCLIKDQLKSVFDWSEGKELLYMIGKIDKKQKQLMIHGFNDANSQAKILLASTKACSEGINLVGASRVVLLDVVWNPSVERQAISRAYRLGQKKVVYTYHLMMHGTTEYEKFRMQSKKDQLSKLVFSSRNNEDDNPKKSDVVFEDEVLDQMVRHMKLKDLFVDCATQPTDVDLIETYGS